MLSFGVCNLRRLKLVPPIALKPITILVGRNSSGKSTFLRAFPLMRQSLMTRTSSPILWYGDLVDFGSFEISVSEDTTNEPITFSFLIDELTIDRRYYWRSYSNTAQGIEMYRGVCFTVSIIGWKERTRISRINIRIKDPKLEYEILIGDDGHVNSVKVDEREAYESLHPIKLQITPGSIFPEMTVVRGDQKQQNTQRAYFIDEDEFIDPISTFVKSNLKRLSDRLVNSLSSALFYLATKDRERIRTELGQTGPKSWREFIVDVCGRDRRGLYPTLHNTLSLSALPNILSRIRSHLRSVITETLYIGPARARSERYYRYQDLAVSEIDPDGKNFPMFLNSLSTYQITSLSRWIEGLFGYGLAVERQAGGGHMSINLISRGVTSNIVDTGYGVSQILPVLGQIWWARNRPSTVGRARAQSLLAIEQPELHLHPAHQALLADALVGEITDVESEPTENRINFLVETHSETLLNRLGELVSKGRIKADDIQVVIFEALDEKSRQTDVRTSSFSPLGELINWPYGFFQPSVR